MFLDDTWRTEAGWLAFVHAALRPALEKLEEKFGTSTDISAGQLSVQMRASRGAELLNLFKFADFSGAVVDAKCEDLRSFPFLDNDARIAKLKAQAYVLPPHPNTHQPIRSSHYAYN